MLGWCPKENVQVHQKLFDIELARIKAAFFAKRLPSDATLNIVALCRSGKHRSVAFLRILKWIFTHEGCAIESCHTTLDKWPRSNCTECANCSICAESKVWLKSDVLRRWKRCSLPP